MQNASAHSQGLPYSGERLQQTTAPPVRQKSVYRHPYDYDTGLYTYRSAVDGAKYVDRAWTPDDPITPMNTYFVHRPLSGYPGGHDLDDSRRRAFRFPGIKARAPKTRSDIYWRSASDTDVSSSPQTLVNKSPGTKSFMTLLASPVSTATKRTIPEITATPMTLARTLDVQSQFDNTGQSHSHFDQEPEEEDSGRGRRSRRTSMESFMSNVSNVVQKFRRASSFDAPHRTLYLNGEAPRSSSRVRNILNPRHWRRSSDPQPMVQYSSTPPMSSAQRPFMPPPSDGEGALPTRGRRPPVPHASDVVRPPSPHPPDEIPNHFRSQRRPVTSTPLMRTLNVHGSPSADISPLALSDPPLAHSTPSSSPRLATSALSNSYTAFSRHHQTASRDFPPSEPAAPDLARQKRVGKRLSGGADASRTPSPAATRHRDLAASIAAADALLSPSPDQRHDRPPNEGRRAKRESAPVRVKSEKAEYVSASEAAMLHQRRASEDLLSRHSAVLPAVPPLPNGVPFPSAITPVPSSADGERRHRDSWRIVQQSREPESRSSGSGRPSESASTSRPTRTHRSKPKAEVRARLANANTEKDLPPIPNPRIHTPPPSSHPSSHPHTLSHLRGHPQTTSSPSQRPPPLPTSRPQTPTLDRVRLQLDRDREREREREAHIIHKARPGWMEAFVADTLYAAPPPATTTRAGPPASGVHHRRGASDQLDQSPMPSISQFR